MKNTYDIVIIGGGIIGMSTAYYLSQSGSSIAIIERDHIGSGSTGRCIAGIRHQFSTPTSIGLMKESVELFSQMKEEFGFSIEFYQGGYLLLAHDQKLVDVFKSNIEIQKKEGVNVSLLTPEEALSIVPALNTDGLLAAAFCQEDGQASPFSVLKGYKKKIDENGGDFYLGDPLVDIKKERNFKISLQSGEILEAKKVLLSAGPWTQELGKILGLDLPLFPERHEAMITERIPKLIDPMIVDYRSDGCYFHQLTTGQVIGCYSPYPNVPGIHTDNSREFLLNLADRMVRLVPELNKASILRHWSGSYTMTPDGNPLVDQTDIENLYVGSGMSGHGFMFGPATGKHLAHYMLNDQWDVNYGEFSLKRSFDSKEALK